VDPAQPILDLPARIASDAADLAHAVAPVCFAVVIALYILTVAARLIRETL